MRVLRHAWIFNALLALLFLQFIAIMFLLAQLSSKCSPQTELAISNNNETTREYKFVVVVVLTPPKKPESRRIIRNTWVSLLNETNAGRVTLLFPIGMMHLDLDTLDKVHDEQKFHSDLLLLRDLHDSYSNLTEKVLQSIVQVYDKYDAQYFLKVDDDSFVNLPKLLHELDLLTRGEPKRSSKLYWGFFSGKSHVYSSSRSKWREREWTLCDRYLPYALGGGYVLGGHLVKFIATNNEYLMRYFSEDVSVGAWLAGTNAFYLHDPRFDTEYKSRGCDNRYLISHKQSDTAMAHKYDNLVLNGKLCWKEFRNRPSYLYNWTVLPSLCCNRTDDPNIP